MFRPVACALFLGTLVFPGLAAQLPTTPYNNLAITPRALQNAAISTSDDVDADSQPARAFRTTVRHLFNEEKFDQLDEIANTVRTEKSRFLGGAWKLRVYYSVLREPGSMTATDAVWNAHFERLQRWIAQKPDSITPRVALADSYLRFAWKARGNGYANTVTSDGWRLFKERVQQAQQTLNAAESLPTKDPHWYRSMQTVALAQGWDRDRAEDLLQKAIALEPGYFYVYEAHSNFLLPKWYGKPGEAEAFAQSVADRIGGPEGDFVYFEMAANLNCCRGKPQMPNISWDRVKQGFAALQQLYGSTNFEKNVMVFMAVHQGDRELAQQLFESIGDNWDENVWHTKEKFDTSKSSLRQGD